MKESILPFHSYDASRSYRYNDHTNLNIGGVPDEGKSVVFQNKWQRLNKG